MDELFFTLEDLLLLNDCVELSIELLQSKLPDEEDKLNGCFGIHVVKTDEDLPEEIQDEFELEKDLEQLIELHDRLNVMIDAFMVEEEMENEELNNFEEVDEMKVPSWVKNLLFVKENVEGCPCDCCNEEPVEEVQEECCGNCEECDCCNEEPVEEVQEECCGNCEECDCCQFFDNEDGILIPFVMEIVDVTMTDLMGQLSILSNILKDEGFCHNCEGYRVFDLKPEYLQLLKVVGYGEGNVCNCEVEVACENEEENAQYAAEFNLNEVEENGEEVVEVEKKKRRKANRKVVKQCCGKCEECNCHKDVKRLRDQEIHIRNINKVEEKMPEFDYEWELKVENVEEENVGVVLQEDSEADLYYGLLYEEAAQYVFNKPVEVIWACEEGVEPPTKNEEDMGFDVKAHFEEDYMMFAPHETKLVPTGLYAAVPTLWGLLAREKGSTGAIGMKCGAGVVDSGYRGEIFIAITNENDCHLVITKDPDVKKAQKVEWVDWDNNTSFDAILYPYKKGIAQLLVKFSPKVETKVVSVEELKAIPSLRGEGKLGSTDNF